MLHRTLSSFEFVALFTKLSHRLIIIRNILKPQTQQGFHMTNIPILCSSTTTSEKLCRDLILQHHYNLLPKSFI